jgi:hypothetical protein
MVAARRFSKSAILAPPRAKIRHAQSLEGSTSMKRSLIFLMAVGTLAACAPSKLAYGQVKSAMIEAGLSESNAACMASRMTDRLSLGQLNKLRQLKGEKQSLGDYVAAVRRVGDAEALSVTASSAALCATGLAKEK